MLSCVVEKYQPTCDDIGCCIRCEYSYLKDDGSLSNPVQTVTPDVVACHLRVQHRVQMHLEDCALSFSVFLLVGKPGSASWQPRKLFAHPSRVTLKCLASATASASFTSHQFTSTTSICIKDDDDRRSILTIGPGVVLHLCSETLLKRDILVMALRRRMYVLPPRIGFFFFFIFRCCFFSI